MTDNITTKWECVQVQNHEDVGKTIEEWQSKGWKLNTYQTLGMGAGLLSYTVNHYLLFEKLPESKN